MPTTLFASASEASSGAVEHIPGFEVAPWIWGTFVAVVVALLLLDLLLVHRTAHVITMKEAGIESAAWIALGVGFTGVMYFWQGGEAAGQYIAGYLIEKSLSVDNVFVWALIMSYFAVPRAYQFRVLFWGVLGALVLRFVFIFTGVALLDRFEWMLFVFGGFLVVTAVRLLRHDDDEVHPERNPVLRAVRRVVPSTSEYEGQKLFTRRNGALLATPLFAVLIVVESSDVVFAVDSIPAILAVSREEFIVFSSNAFAILGLRALYFLLADLRERFTYLQQGLAVILAFVGAKMILSHWYHVDTMISLLVIAVVLTVAIGASWRRSGGPEPVEAAQGTSPGSSTNGTGQAVPAGGHAGPEGADADPGDGASNGRGPQSGVERHGSRSERS